MLFHGILQLSVVKASRQVSTTCKAPLPPKQINNINIWNKNDNKRWQWKKNDMTNIIKTMVNKQWHTKCIARKGTVRDFFRKNRILVKAFRSMTLVNADTVNVLLLCSRQSCHNTGAELLYNRFLTSDISAKVGKCYDYCSASFSVMEQISEGQFPRQNSKAYMKREVCIFLKAGPELFFSGADESVTWRQLSLHGQQAVDCSAVSKAKEKKWSVYIQCCFHGIRDIECKPNFRVLSSHLLGYLWWKAWYSKNVFSSVPISVCEKADCRPENCTFYPIHLHSHFLC